MYLSKELEGFELVTRDMYPLAEPRAGSWAYCCLRSTRGGAARVWQAGFDSATREVVTVYGQLGGKMQTARVEVEPKGKRGHAQQAVIAVNSRCATKMSKDGFEFARDAPETGEGGDFVDAERVPSGAPEPFGKPRPAPMLAKDLAAVKKEIKFPVAVQPKLDGVRCMIDWPNSGDARAERVVRLTSRGGKDFSHLEALLVDEASDVLRALPCGAVLDGELVVPGDAGGSDFQATTSAARTTKVLTDVARESMRFLVFGVFLPSEPDATFAERDAALARAFGRAGALRRIARVEHALAASMADVRALHDAFVARGEEGAMVYALDGVYAPGRRTDALLKHKTFAEFEGTVEGVVAGKGRERASAQVLVRCDSGRLVKMHPEGPLAERQRWLADPSLVVGKRITYKCQGLTKAGLPRFPVAKGVRDYE